MKCEHCGRNNATIFYRRTVNGRSSEKRLCADCAAELGFAEGLGAVLPFLPRVTAADGRAFDAEGFTPAARRALSVLSEPAEPEPLLSGDEERSLRRERERNAMEVQLAEAVEAEDYERAAALRDALRNTDN